MQKASLSVGGVQLGMHPDQVLKLWGRPLSAKVDPLAGHPPRSPSPYSLWTYPHDESVRFYSNRVQAIQATHHPLKEHTTPLPGPGTPLQQLLGFWGDPREDAYGDGSSIGYTIDNQHTTLSFHHDGQVCTSLYVVGDAQEGFIHPSSPGKEQPR